MTTTALKSFDWRKLRLTRSGLQRMVLAGSAWGLAMSAGIVGMTAWNYGVICLDHAAFTTTVSLITGIFAIGPIALYGR